MQATSMHAALSLAGLTLVAASCTFDPNAAAAPADLSGGDGPGVAGSDSGATGPADASVVDASPPACIMDPSYVARPDSDHRYRYEANGLFYDQAQASCAETGGHLAVIDDIEENVFLATFGGAPWIGFNDYSVEGEFTWVAPSTTGFTLWSGGEPSDSGGKEDCGILQGDNWNDGECSNIREFVCECDPTRTEPPPPACMTSSAYSEVLQGRRYRVESDGASHAAAKASCAAEGGHLVVITDPVENTYVKDMISDTAWIGYSDVVSEGTFQWVTGSASTYTRWAGPQPDNNGEGGEDCVEIANNGEWNDQGCDSDRDYVCECDPGVAINSLGGL